jgi:hypothetical protein
MIATSLMYSNKENELIRSITQLDLLDVLKKETLSFPFVINYILNEEYQKNRKERDITIETVINYQPHLTDMFKMILNKTN